MRRSSSDFLSVKITNCEGSAARLFGEAAAFARVGAGVCSVPTADPAPCAPVNRAGVCIPPHVALPVGLGDGCSCGELMLMPTYCSINVWMSTRGGVGRTEPVPLISIPIPWPVCPHPCRRGCGVQTDPISGCSVYGKHGICS